jgi:hypothetical protein
MRYSNVRLSTASEKQIQSAIVEYLQLRGIPYAVTDASRAFGIDGKPRKSKVDKNWPDISAVLPVKVPVEREFDIRVAPKKIFINIGIAFYIEVKTLTGNISAGQKEKLQNLSDSGAICLVARSVEDVDRIVKLFFNKTLSAVSLSAVREALRLSLLDKRKARVRSELREAMARMEGLLKV